MTMPHTPSTAIPDPIAWNTRFTVLGLHAPHQWLGVPAGVKRTRDLIFKAVGPRALHLDIYQPEAAQQPLPVIVWIGGGGWRRMGYKGPEQVSAWLAGEGFAVIGAEYRTTAEGVDVLEIITDVQAAVRWVRAHAEEYGLDAARIGAYGDSAGGHLVEMLGVGAGLDELTRVGPYADQSSAVDAVCSIFGPSDLRPYADDNHTELFHTQGAERARQVALASPIDHVSPAAPPHLLLHGDADTIVPLEHSERFMAALHAAGVECTLVELPGIGHEGTIYRARQTMAIVRAFFERHLHADGSDA